ncbi:hypothetical protein RB620_10120 [Paenibacillus sp. LHD-117]|uniref:hypothetical protein n=1 Tax=Paenibacillus sp. LHD-117 TaxID=3071412 RepID=UPI0027E165BD|nr:hypothetical protein [Paenibacillus sp. LHD-117]MDQ6419786.1 hypothetical protein [Paenibacillus sp. LHD-117]
MKRIGCFHAHHSNIELIDRALEGFNVELIHFVDPGLDRLKKDPGFTMQFAEKKVLDTLEWIESCHVDAILVTCTFFTGILRDDLHASRVPVIKIDAPLFELLTEQDRPVVLVFTNPQTIEGTMKRFNQLMAGKGIAARAEARLLEGTFELIMQGRKEDYLREVTAGFIRIAKENPDLLIAAAQLSMAPAARDAASVISMEGIRTANPLDALSGYLEDKLSLGSR